MNKRSIAVMQKFRLSLLASSVLCLTQTSFALQSLSDLDLRNVDGQDGIAIDVQYSKVNIDELYWQDKAGSSTGTGETTMRAVAQGVEITKRNSASSTLPGLTATIQAGADSTGKTGIHLTSSLMPFTASVDKFQICDSNGCDNQIDNKIAIQSDAPLDIALKTTDGLFNKNAMAELTLGLKNINIYAGLKAASEERAGVTTTPASNTYNQLIFKDTNFNFLGKGVAYIDQEQGFMLSTNVGGLGAAKASKTQAPNTQFGFVDFTRVVSPDQTGASTATYQEGGQATGSGLNLELMLKTGVVNSNDDYNLTGADGLIRVGASGRIVNAYLQFRGTDAIGTTLANSVMGYATPASGTATVASPIIGGSGIAMRIRGEFTNDGDSMLTGNAKPTTLEIGGAGQNSYGFEFSNLSPLISNSNERAYFDSGNIYVNLADTKHLRMPVNTVLNQSRLRTNDGTDSFLTVDDDYQKQQIHGLTSNPRSVVIGIREFDFQALSKRGRFTSNAGMSGVGARAIPSTEGTSNSWGLGLPFYNMNANLALYTTQYATGKQYYTVDSANKVIPVTLKANSDRLGLALALSVEGRNTDGSKTTSIMLLDGDQDMYIGLRNIDMYLRGYGSVGTEGGQLNFDLPNLLMVMNAEVAGGFLPSYQDPNASNLVVQNPFSTQDDVLGGIRLKLLGDMNFSLLPRNSLANGSRLGIVGRYNLTEGAIQISDPIDGSMIGFDNLKGLIEFNNEIVIDGSHGLNKDIVGFHYNFHFNPDQKPNEVFRVRDINLYPPENKTNPALSPPGQRLGELVMTGGNLGAKLNVIPRNGAF